MREIKEGRCKNCRNVLVQICEDGGPVETYHPAEVADPKNRCPELIPIPGTEYFSFNVPFEMFEEDEDDSSNREDQPPGETLEVSNSKRTKL